MPDADDACFRPIIYVRGYAGSESAVEETVATPYMGFNLGATKVRQRWDGAITRHVFESPLVRLMKDHGYTDVYEEGDVRPSSEPIPRRSVIVYRYYDQVSEDLGTGDRPDIEVYARGLSDLVARVRDQVCLADGEDPADFRLYLVAHSMGGLICRTFLQNPDAGDAESRACVDKVFTYATPHNGIDVRVLGNVPGFFSRNNADNFNRGRMRDYLRLPDDGDERADSLDGDFDPERFFCLVGTNAKDYDVAAGWSSRVVGPISDGLVRIDNATVRGAPRAYVHRSHSGHYGIVNSEEGYQNLTRFLFGDVRVDGRLVVEDITLPRKVRKALEDGKRVRASYHFETVVRPRGARYDLHRRLASEGSAVFRSYDELFHPDRAGLAEPRHPRLFSVYLSGRNRTNPRRKPLVFAVDLSVKVPEYEIRRPHRGQRPLPRDADRRGGPAQGGGRALGRALRLQRQRHEPHPAHGRERGAQGGGRRARVPHPRALAPPARNRCDPRADGASVAVRGGRRAAGGRLSSCPSCARPCARGAARRRRRAWSSAA